jgi:hypothetical protein
VRREGRGEREKIKEIRRENNRKESGKEEGKKLDT